jgi:C-terminal peptidase prc
MTRQLNLVGSGSWLCAVVVALGAVNSLAASPAAPPATGDISRWESTADPVGPRKPAPDERPTADQLRSQAAQAEAAGDWEAAFAAYCELHAIDRVTPGVREKLNSALRRVQQLRRHRDPVYQHYASSLSVRDASRLFGEVVRKVPAHFAEPSRSSPQQLWANGLEELDRALLSPAFRQAFLDHPLPEKVDEFRTTLRRVWASRVIADESDGRTALKRLVAAAQDAFAVRVPSALAVEFVCGACSGLDEYTVFLTPAQAGEAAELFADLSTYGIYVEFDEEGLIVEGIAPGSWITFQTPNLRKGDRIARINGRTMDGAEMGEVAASLRTPMGGAHEIELVPPGPHMMPSLLRLPLDVPTVYGGHMISTRDGIGYLRIGEFQSDTPAELDQAIGLLKVEGMRVLVLDLRGNRGGSFTSGVEAARRLLPSGLIVTTQGHLGQVAGQVFSSDSGMNALDVPLVVLIDAETASAAEVVAVALRDNNRAVIVGMPSFGKGTIQYPLKLSAGDDPMNPKSGVVRVTIARLIAPRGTPINGVGVTPHFLEPDPTRQLELAIERAFELLQPMMPDSPIIVPPSY